MSNGIKVLNDYLSKAGPFVGPRGGKWADAKHTIPWKEDAKGKDPMEAINNQVNQLPVLPDSPAKQALMLDAGKLGRAAGNLYPLEDMVGSDGKIKNVVLRDLPAACAKHKAKPDRDVMRAFFDGAQAARSALYNK